ncbi:MAG: hypothetical protein L0Z73_11215 [Gammaproteobacteria bacterium]|nr:hypothetical protein [Gammaproteobacteria bacterium]
MNYVTTFRILILALPIAAVVACGMLGTKYEKMHGRIQHEIHDDPMPNTIVVALWQGKANDPAGGGKILCYHVETTVTDEKGFFTIPVWREPGDFKDLSDKAVHVHAYRKHYRTSELTSQIITPKNYIYYLAKPRAVDDETAARQDRLRYLQQLIGNTTCDLQGKSRGNLQPMYAAIVDEAEELVVTAQDREIVQKLKSWLAFVTPTGE